jgi:hypothetical protein
MGCEDVVATKMFCCVNQFCSWQVVAFSGNDGDSLANCEKVRPTVNSVLHLRPARCLLRLPLQHPHRPLHSWRRRSASSSPSSASSAPSSSGSSSPSSSSSSSSSAFSPSSSPSSSLSSSSSLSRSSSSSLRHPLPRHLRWQQ